MHARTYAAASLALAFDEVLLDDDAHQEAKARNDRLLEELDAHARRKERGVLPHVGLQDGDPVQGDDVGEREAVVRYLVGLVALSQRELRVRRGERGLSGIGETRGGEGWVRHGQGNLKCEIRISHFNLTLKCELRISK